MKRALIALGLLLPSISLAAPPIKGMAMGLYFREADEKHYSFPDMLDEVQATGADHVSFVVAWSQPNVRSSTLAPNAKVTIADDRLRRLIRRAKKRHLKVLLFPIIEIEVRRPLEWRGTLAPRDIRKWWISYERFIVHYAKIAADEGVTILSIGSELNSTEVWRDRWFHLIGRTRKIFSGKLLYSGNWDHYPHVSFWERVDYFGVTGYNELTKNNDASEKELHDAWRTVRKRLVAHAKKIDRPLILTEIGYTSQDGAAVRPWDYTSRAKVDLEEQRRCYAAFVSAWQDEEKLEGVFWWNWFGPGGKNDTYYTPKGKPAENVVRRWYGAPARSPR